MQHQSTFQRSSLAMRFNTGNQAKSRKIVIGLILVVALVAFEAFNFDTTRFALGSILGEATFLGVMWATILAIAFCAIDFAGLARIFTPERGEDEPKAVLFLTGAWLLGATMNAIMTWWAVSLSLLSHDFGNEVLTRQQLLTMVPVFVAALVLLTRILFIGAFSVAGEGMFSFTDDVKADLPSKQPVRELPAGQPKTNAVGRSGVYPVSPQPAQASRSTPVTNSSRPTGRTHPRPGMPVGSGPAPTPMAAKSRR